MSYTFKHSHPYIEEFVDSYLNGEIKLNKERIQLFEYLERDVLNRDDVWFDTRNIEQCVQFIERWFFPLASFQKFLICFVFLMTNENGFETIFYDSFFWTMGRGMGKSAFFGAIALYLISPLYGVHNYHISVVANSEDQARKAFETVYETLNENRDDLSQFFYWNKVGITCKQTGSHFRYQTSSVDTKDGGREGCVCFDEIHGYEDDKRVSVFEGGRGKVPHYRSFYTGTYGYVRDGYFDKIMEISRDILSGEDQYTRMFPWICTLDNLDEANDPEMWQKACPMHHPPATLYSKNHFVELKKAHNDTLSGKTDKVSFILKNLNTLIEDVSHTAVPRDELIAATRPYPEDTSEFSCIGACDFAQSRDFSACGVLFMDENEEYIWKHHSFVNANFLRQAQIKAPIAEWEEQGLCTIVDEPLIGVHHIVNWFIEMREQNPELATIVLDQFKLNTLRIPLEEAGFEVIYIRNPRARLAMVSDKVDRAFAGHEIAWGEDYMMRWYANNVYVTYDKQGNKIYEKKEAKLRKTDGFMALLFAFAYADTNLRPPTDYSLLDNLYF